MPQQPARGRRWRTGTVLVCAAAGVFLSTAASVSRGADLRPAPASLVQVVRERDRVVQDRAQRVEALQAEVRTLADARAPQDARLNALREEETRLAPGSGAEAVRGPGVTVTLDDSRKDANHPPAGFTAADMVVHQQDVQAVVNALWKGGAEAVMVQDQRIVSTSAVRCVGSTLILQGRVYAPPYTITAIGDGDVLVAALDADPTVRIYRQYVAAVGLRYSVDRKDDIEVPAFAGRITPQHAVAAG